MEMSFQWSAQTVKPRRYTDLMTTSPSIFEWHNLPTQDKSTIYREIINNVETAVPSHTNHRSDTAQSRPFGPFHACTYTRREVTHVLKFAMCSKKIREELMPLIMGMPIEVLCPGRPYFPVRSLQCLFERIPKEHMRLVKKVKFVCDNYLQPQFENGFAAEDFGLGYLPTYNFEVEFEFVNNLKDTMWFRDGTYADEGVRIQSLEEIEVARGISGIFSTLAELERCRAEQEGKLKASWPEEIDDRLNRFCIGGQWHEFDLVEGAPKYDINFTPTRTYE
ncbi:hypothetical protein EJ08DRAFT_677449 [Tothia fuscella]|uniref:Uncharacterized protein n=1 Tax=Tothia fuscella TaxID=1048955 RepID=A0A9P4NUK2_9PEZI|nr:hypothetical protein EJ08DRAFT_677449 [Tothia fuscella]